MASSDPGTTREFTPRKGENITPAYDFWTKPSNAPCYVGAVSPDGKLKLISAPSFGKKSAATDTGRLAPRRKPGKRQPTIPSAATNPSSITIKRTEKMKKTIVLMAAAPARGRRLGRHKKDVLRGEGIQRHLP